MNYARAYTDAQIDLIAKMLAESKSSREIGLVVGVSRNAIIGIVHRNKRLREIGFKLPSGNAMRKSPKRRNVPEPVRSKAKPTRPKTATPPIEPEPIIETKLENLVPLMVLLEDLKPHHCRFPIGDPRFYDDFGFCGHAKSKGSPYCAAHRKITCV